MTNKGAFESPRQGDQFKEVQKLFWMRLSRQGNQLKEGCGWDETGIGDCGTDSSGKSKRDEKGYDADNNNDDDGGDPPDDSEDDGDDKNNVATTTTPKNRKNSVKSMQNDTKKSWKTTRKQFENDPKTQMPNAFQMSNVM